MQNPVDIRELQERVERESSFVDALTLGMNQVIVGKKHLVESLLIGLLSDGHILLEGVPGLAKTLAIKTLSDLIKADFSRIQFTPDLLPADVVGTQIYSIKDEAFRIKRGPIFANFVLADEINRAPAKVQSALLEAMQERQVTIGDETFKLDDPFLVLATQNPIEQEGTYPLPEAQTDRFMIKEKITYPKAEEEFEILNRIESGAIDRKIDPVLKIEDIDRVQEIVKKVYIDNSIKQYITRIVDATRKGVSSYVREGASPRARINFLKAAKASALINGRNYVIPDDVKLMKNQILRHRLALTYSAVADNVAVEDVIDTIVNSVEAP
jgi:MoxR-like ATPase